MKFSKKLIKRFNNLPYQRKLFLSHLTVLIIPITILGIFSFFQSRELLIKSKLTDIEYYFSKASITLNDAVSTCESILDEIYVDPKMSQVLNYSPDKNSDSEENLYFSNLETVFSPYIYNIKSNNEFIREITFYSYRDNLSYRSIIRPYSEFKADNLSKNSTGRFKWFYNGKMIVLSRSIVYSEYKGELVIMINPLKLLNTTSSQFFNYNIAMFSADGECIYSHILPEDKGKDLLLETISSSEQRATISGNHYIVKNVVLNNGIILSAFINEHTFLNGIENILITTIIILLVCLFFSVLLTIAFSGTLTKRITLLNKEINKAKSGNLDIKIHSVCTDEIGVLTNNFSDMISHINDLINNIYESKKIQQKAELKALQSQIKPHFLYNILQAVNWNAINRGDDDTSKIVVNLSNFYRSILNKGDDDISVEDELKIVEYYLNIEKVIYIDLFSVEFNIDPRSLHCLAIPLVLQPLVENAVEHGIRKSEKSNCKITITADIVDDKLLFTVSDDGIGIDPKLKDIILTKNTTGYGLKNINERIQLRFGDEYGLKLTSLQNPTTFTITMPAKPFVNQKS